MGDIRIAAIPSEPAIHTPYLTVYLYNIIGRTNEAIHRCPFRLVYLDRIQRLSYLQYDILYNNIDIFRSRNSQGGDYGDKVRG